MIKDIKMYSSFDSRTALDTAVNDWITDETNARSTYGDINTWDVSGITDFSDLFKDKNNFNSDISNWDVSNGTDFSNMFSEASAFKPGYWQLGCK